MGPKKNYFFDRQGKEMGTKTTLKLSANLWPIRTNMRAHLSSGWVSSGQTLSGRRISYIVRHHDN